MFLFFFSSRRRHTRSLRDWSSDVCSSDLVEIVEETDPGDAGEEMHPAEQELHSGFGKERHRVPPVNGGPDGNLSDRLGKIRTPQAESSRRPSRGGNTARRCRVTTAERQNDQRGHTSQEETYDGNSHPHREAHATRPAPTAVRRRGARALHRR